MPSKQSRAAQRESQNRAVTKYRRLRTLQNKVKELSAKCNLRMSLIIEDSQFNKVTEYYSDELIKVENIVKRMQAKDATDTNHNGKNSQIKLLSVNIFSKGKRGKHDSNEDIPEDLMAADEELFDIDDISEQDLPNE